MTENTPTFASDQARDLAARYPNAQLPKRGSGSGKKLTTADVRKAIAKLPDDAPAPPQSGPDAPAASMPVPAAEPEPGAEPEPLPDSGVERAPALAPEVIAHGRPTLSSGSDGPAVAELGVLLGRLGFESSLTRGENPYSILDPSVMEAVRAFRADKKVKDDGDLLPQGADADNFVGPRTWAAILDATS